MSKEKINSHFQPTVGLFSNLISNAQIRLSKTQISHRIAQNVHIARMQIFNVIMISDEVKLTAEQSSTDNEI